MAENSQTQQILVPFDFSEAANNAIVYAMELARLFKCEITIFYTVNKKNGKLNVNEDGSENTIKQKLSILANNLIADYTIAINVYMFTGEVHEIIHKIYPKINAIALIVGLNSKKSRMHFFTSNTIVTNYRDLRIPLIVVSDEAEQARWVASRILEQREAGL
ncbi:MAG: universal stress protein, partial [Bacteroidota bacterium]